MNISDWRIEVIDGLKTTLKNMPSQIRQVTNKAIDTAIHAIDPKSTLDIKIFRIFINECNLIGILEIHFKICKDDSIIKVEYIRFLESHNISNLSSDKIRKCGTVIYDFDYIKERNILLNFFQRSYAVNPDIKEYAIMYIDKKDSSKTKVCILNDLTEIEHKHDAFYAENFAHLYPIDPKNYCSHFQEQTKHHEMDWIVETAVLMPNLNCDIETRYQPVVLYLQDDSVGLNYTSQTGLLRPGPLKNLRQHALYIHPTSAVTFCEDKRNWPVEAKESIRCAELVAALPDDTRLVCIADRECDIHKFMIQIHRQPEINWLIRVAQDHKLVEGDTLLERLTVTPVLGEVRFTLPDRSGGLTVRAKRITLRPVGCEPVTVTALRALEESPPAGVESLDWFLLTNRVANSVAQAAELIQWYIIHWNVWLFSESLKPAAGWNPVAQHFIDKVQTMRDAKGYTTVEFRKNLAEIIGEVHHKDEIVDVLRHGRPYASLVSDKDASYIKASVKSFLGKC